MYSTLDMLFYKAYIFIKIYFALFNFWFRCFTLTYWKREFLYECLVLVSVTCIALLLISVPRETVFAKNLTLFI